MSQWDDRVAHAILHGRPYLSLHMTRGAAEAAARWQAKVSGVTVEVGELESPRWGYTWAAVSVA